jgi:hypothetical protein
MPFNYYVTIQAIFSSFFSFYFIVDESKLLVIKDFPVVFFFFFFYQRLVSEMVFGGQCNNVKCAGQTCLVILERELIPQMQLEGLFCSKQGFCDLKNKSVLQVLF